MSVLGKDFKPYTHKPTGVWAKQITEDQSVETLEGTMCGKAGDYLVVGTSGEKYIVKKHIFQCIYEPAWLTKAEKASSQSTKSGS